VGFEELGGRALTERGHGPIRRIQGKLCKKVATGEMFKGRGYSDWRAVNEAALAKKHQRHVFGEKESNSLG